MKVRAATILSLCLIASQASAQYIEEVIISAQKTDQNLQVVPVAVTAFSGVLLEEAAVKDIFDMQNIAPGLRIGQNQSSTTSNFNIRGVGTSASNFGLESSVGLYVDGVWRARQSSMINNLVDVEAVEVLRGPQGTLFGKNTPSGAILLKTRKPSFETGGFVDAMIGNYNLRNYSGAFNLPLVDDVLAFRITGFSGDRDGVIDDVNLGKESINDRDRWGVRGQLLYTPSDRLDVRLIVDRSEIDEACCAALTFVDSLDANGIPGVQEDGSDFKLQQLGATIFEGSDYEKYQVAYSHLPVSENEDSGTSIELNYDLGMHTLTSISAWRSFDTHDDIDADFSNLFVFNRIEDARQKSFSQELRIASDTTESWRYIAGLYYFTQDLDNDTVISTGPFMTPYVLDLQPDLVSLINGVGLVSQATMGLVPPPVSPFANQASAFTSMRQDHESRAIFGQLEWDISSDLMLTLGVRYTEEEKKLAGIFTEDANGPPIDLAATSDHLCVAQFGFSTCSNLGLLEPDFNPADFPSVFFPYSSPNWGYYLPGLEIIAPRSNLNERITDENVSGTVKLTWRPMDNLLTYASWGTGYKSGGTNTDRIGAGQSPLFDAETADTWEVGVKLDLPEQRMRINLALYDTTVKDFQSNSFRGTGFNLTNAGEILVQGGELEFWWTPLDNTDLAAAYVYTDAKYESFDQANCWQTYPFHTGISDPTLGPDGTCDRSGDRVSFSPENFFFLALTQRFPIGDMMELSLRGEYSYIGDQVMDASNDPFLYQDGYSLLNASALLDFGSGLSLQVWGRNLTDERYTNVRFTAPLQDGRLNAYPGEPKTWGLGARYEF